MNVISAALDEIARRAKEADRGLVDMLHGQLKALDAGAKAAISLGTLSDADLVETGEARRRALDALDATQNAMMRRQLDLIAAVPAERASKGTLSPMSAPALLVSAIRYAGDEIDHLVRNHGEGFEAFDGDTSLGRVNAHSVGIDKDDLVIEGVGRWPLSRIEAVSHEDGMAFVLDDGTHIEVRRMP